MNHESYRHISEDMPEVLARFGAKAIETQHAGIKFRSRIEARWAIFLDSLKLTWEYEAEGFDLGDGVWYLPDFWLAKLRLWVEIKGADPDEDACDKATRLAQQSGFPVYVFFGGITMPDSPTGPPSAYAFFPDGTADNGYLWCECRQCGLVGIHYEGRSDRLPCKEPFLESKREGKGCRRSEHGDKGGHIDSPSLVKAYSEARSMRFSR